VKGIVVKVLVSVLLLAAAAAAQSSVAPQLIHKVPPEYTEQARRAGLEGTVVLTVVVDKEGRVTNIRVSHSLGKGLDEKAIEAVRQWLFSPGRKDGRPVAVEASIEVIFNLLGDKPPVRV
jgi:periplasmic protein TonB